MKSHQMFINLLFFTLILSACGGQNDRDVNTRVVSISIKDRTIRVGEGTVVSFGLEYNGSGNTPFSSSEDVSLVVRLPAGTQFREGTAEIQRAIDDKGVRPFITNCPETGEQYLDFRLDGDDLRSGSDPSGSADVEVTLTLDGIAPVSVGIVQAKSDRNDLIYACGAFFSSDAEDSIQVVP